MSPISFPLHSEDRGEKTMADLALESFSISIPLIEFHDAASQCTDDSAPTSLADSSEDYGPVVKGHPHVVTRFDLSLCHVFYLTQFFPRTQLRIVRETSLFNATAYNAVRNEIKVYSVSESPWPSLATD
jgi:hypothetical protein